MIFGNLVRPHPEVMGCLVEVVVAVPAESMLQTRRALLAAAVVVPEVAPALRAPVALVDSVPLDSPCAAEMCVLRV